MHPWRVWHSGASWGLSGSAWGALGGPWGQMDENFTLRGRPVKTACLTGRTFGLKCWFLEGSLGVLGVSWWSLGVQGALPHPPTPTGPSGDIWASVLREPSLPREPSARAGWRGYLAGRVLPIAYCLGLRYCRLLLPNVHIYCLFTRSFEPRGHADCLLPIAYCLGFFFLTNRGHCTPDMSEVHHCFPHQKQTNRGRCTPDMSEVHHRFPHEA